MGHAHLPDYFSLKNSLYDGSSITPVYDSLVRLQWCGCSDEQLTKNSFLQAVQTRKKSCLCCQVRSGTEACGQMSLVFIACFHWARSQRSLGHLYLWSLRDSLVRAFPSSSLLHRGLASRRLVEDVLMPCRSWMSWGSCLSLFPGLSLMSSREERQQWSC